ncbi:MAG: LysR substrate-binding domain-containing protein [Pseudomonadota bacterium]
MDCEVRFAAVHEASTVDVLFRDFVLPMASPVISKRLSALPRRKQLEGFPLLHLDFYKDDAAVPDWAEWIHARKLQRTEPNRGIRYQRIATALEAVLADAGLALCGMALAAPLLDAGRLSLPFAMSTGKWTDHAFIARFRADSVARPQVRRFREWLDAESASTREWLTRKASAKRRARR